MTEKISDSDHRRFVVASLIAAAWVVLAIIVELFVTTIVPRLPSSLVVHFGAGKGGLSNAYEFETQAVIVATWAGIAFFAIVVTLNVLFALRGQFWAYVVDVFVCMLLPLVFAGITASIVWQSSGGAPESTMPTSVQSTIFAISMVSMALGLASVIAIPRRIVSAWEARHRGSVPRLRER